MNQPKSICCCPQPVRRRAALVIAVTLLLTGPTSIAVFAVAQELVPVSGKRAMTWGQQEVSREPIVPFEELPTPRPDGATQLNSVTQDDFPDLSLEQLESVDAEPVDDPDRYGPGTGNEIIRQRYPDGKVQILRFVIQDEQGNYLNHGPWTLYGRQGQILAKGQFEQGLMSGNWQRWHPAGSDGLFGEKPFDEFAGPFLSSSGFVAGKQHGSWIVMDRHRRKILEMPYRQGKRDGLATWYWPNGGKMRQASFQDGKMQGDLIEWDKNNRITRRSSWDNNRELITRNAFYYRSQKRSEDHFLGPPLQFQGSDDWWNARPARFESVGPETRHGPSVEWYRNGQVKMRGQFREDQRAGKFAWWHENGQKQAEGEFETGTREGRWRWWHDAGTVAIDGQYRNSQPVGTWTWWFKDGKVDRTENMDAAGLEELDTVESIQPESDRFDSDSPMDLSLESLELPVSDPDDLSFSDED